MRLLWGGKRKGRGGGEREKEMEDVAEDDGWVMRNEQEGKEKKRKEKELN